MSIKKLSLKNGNETPMQIIKRLGIETKGQFILIYPKSKSYHFSIYWREHESKDPLELLAVSSKGHKTKRACIIAAKKLTEVFMCYTFADSVRVYDQTGEKISLKVEYYRKKLW